jgi:hypothetical protein
MDREDSMDNRTFRLNEPRVVADTIDGEVLAIDMATGAYVSLRDWSTFVWSHLLGGATVDGAQQALSQHVGDAPDDAVAVFADRLHTEGLIVPSDPVASGDAQAHVVAIDVPTAPWSGLAVESFTDMADLILLDPVHDVDADKGWPAPPTA